MLASITTIHVNDRSRDRPLWKCRLNVLPILVIGDKADFHAFRLVGDRQSVADGEGSGFRLRQVTKGEHGAGEFILLHREQDVTLVLAGVGGFE